MQYYPEVPMWCMVSVVSFPLPSSALPSKSFWLNFLSGPLSLLSFFHSFYWFRSPFLWPSQTRTSTHQWYLKSLLVTCFQDGLLAIWSSKQLDTQQIAKLAALLETWSLGITWKFLPTLCSLFKSFLQLSLRSGWLLFRIGCLTTLWTFAHPNRNKVSYAQAPLSLPLYPSHLGLLVLDASLAQELHTSHV